MEHVDKPWGGYITFARNEKVTVKILRLDKREEMSLQSHKKRDEEWYIVKGRVRVQIGHSGEMLENMVLKKGDTVEIPRKVMHRASGIDDSLILEISRGEADEEDIIRYDDKYGRAKK